MDGWMVDILTEGVVKGGIKKFAIIAKGCFPLPIHSREQHAIHFYRDLRTVAKESPLILEEKLREENIMVLPYHHHSPDSGQLVDYIAKCKLMPFCRIYFVYLLLAVGAAIIMCLCFERYFHSPSIYHFLD